MSDDIVVNLRGGTYNLTSPITLGTSDSGTNGHTVVYQAYNGETPVISSGRTITGWTAASNGEYKASMGSLNFRQLYVNGVRATRARYPDLGSDFQLQGSDKTNKLLQVLSSQISNWSNLGKVEMNLELQWAENYLRLKSFTTAGGTANVSLQDHEAGILFQRPFPVLSNGSPLHFENAHEFLNEPGEFYVDTAAQTVYYKPRSGEDMSTATVQAPTLPTLVEVKGTSLDAPVHDLRFTGITFAQTTWMEASNNGLLNGQGGNFNLSADPSNHQYVDRPCGRGPRHGRRPRLLHRQHLHADGVHRPRPAPRRPRQQRDRQRRVRHRGQRHHGGQVLRPDGRVPHRLQPAHVPGR